MEENKHTEPARLALIDDHPLFRIGLRNSLELDPSIRVVIDTGSPQEALMSARDQVVDVAIVDLLLPEMTGIELTIQLRQMQPNCCVLGLSMLDEPIRIAGILRAGAYGFAHKTQPPDQILAAIHQVLGGVRYLPPSISAEEVELLAARSDAWPLDQLTHREREVFTLMVDGHSNDDIATKLFIARRTVETHRHRVMHKLSARSVVDLVRIALRHGIAVH